MTTTFKLTPKQVEANKLLGSESTHCMLFGGSRSGKTFLLVRAVVIRALKSAKSRHAILRFRFNHVKTSIAKDTFPKVMELCFPEVVYKLDKTDWYVEFSNGSQIWFGGLDDNERVEKILGNEYVTIYFNECSQISFHARETAITRLAQNCEGLKQKAYYDCNPTTKGHWTYKLFKENINPDDKKPLKNADDYTSFQINPADNPNLSQRYLAQLKEQSKNRRKRFFDGDYRDANENALWSEAGIDKYRITDDDLPQLVRVVVAVDPSGADEGDDGSVHDAIGIAVVALGSDGKAYLLEDLTMNGGPAEWSRVAVNAYERHQADRIIGEKNFGGAMVKHTIKTAGPNVSYKDVTASRGKVVRAEPIAALAEEGKIRHVGEFQDLEEELCDFTTTGYGGERSPNRADAYIWGCTELFGGIVKNKKKIGLAAPRLHGGGWMGT